VAFCEEKSYFFCSGQEGGEVWRREKLLFFFFGSGQGGGEVWRREMALGEEREVVLREGLLEGGESWGL